LRDHFLRGRFERDLLLVDLLLVDLLLVLVDNDLRGDFLSDLFNVNHFLRDLSSLSDRFNLSDILVLSDHFSLRDILVLSDLQMYLVLCAALNVGSTLTGNEKQQRDSVLS